MRVIVAIKQVPFVDQLRFDKQAKRLIREGVESEINPFDKRALTKAVELKKQGIASSVTAITMGPPQAKIALTEALAMGADRAIHLLGKEFAGADTLATARALALACRQIGFDLVLTGKYATDAETAQVPGMLAELLDVAQVTSVTALEFLPETKILHATRELDAGFETVEVRLPAVASVGERLIKPLKVSPADLESAKDRPIEVLSPADLAEDVSLFGLTGSPTWVSDIYPVEPQRRHIVSAANVNPDAIAQTIVQDLMAEGLFGEWKSRPPEIIHPNKRSDNTTARDIWVVSETEDDEVSGASLELLGRSVQLANESDGRVGAVLIGSNIQGPAMVLAAFGADRILAADKASLASYATESYSAVLADAIVKYRPFAVLFPSTSQGRDLAPRVAARLNLGLTGDCIGLDIDGEGRLVQLKPAFGGNIVAPILSKTRPAMATVRPGMLQAAQPDNSREPELVELDVNSIPKPRVRVLSREKSAESATELDMADVVIGVGMGLGGPENLAAVKEMAAILDAPIGGTRKVVDAGWLPRQVQIGLTGRSIAPRLYIAIGISGKFNHVVGIGRAGIILAINNNPEADIFKHADYGIVGDAIPVVSALTNSLRMAKRISRSR